ncbi:MAG: 5,6-dimethylbenzimidazole synthase [Sphingobium sp.]|nr:MAG: 5,6-dimethylbenzimidazole synthase [Sphingobium sp.]
MTAPKFDTDFREKLDQLFLWRRDVRHFRSTPLPEGMIDDLLDITCLSPSVGNSQTWRFVRVLSPERRSALVHHVDAHKHTASRAYEGSQRAHYDRLRLHGLDAAPEVLAVFCDEMSAAGQGLGCKTMPETLCWSVIAAIQTLWLAARARGIGMGWVSILDPALMNSLLDVPREWRFVALLCLGYPTDESDTPELARHGWQERLPSTLTRFIR